MKSRYLLFSIGILLFITQTASTVVSQTIQNRFEFGYVKSDYDWAGESVWLANTKERNRVSRKSIAALGADGLGKININGNDIDLKRVKYYPPDKNFKVGRGGHQIWKGSEVTIRIDYVITQLCPPGTEECLIYYYKGIMDVTYKRTRKKVKITGFGGS